MIVFGKIKLPAVRDDKGEGFVHVRYVELSGSEKMLILSTIGFMTLPIEYAFYISYITWQAI